MLRPVMELHWVCCLAVLFCVVANSKASAVFFQRSRASTLPDFLVPLSPGCRLLWILNWSFLPYLRFLCALVPVSFPIFDQENDVFHLFRLFCPLTFVILSFSLSLPCGCHCSWELCLSCSVGSPPDRQALWSRTHPLDQRWLLPMAFRRQTVNLVSLSTLLQGKNLTKTERLCSSFNLNSSFPLCSSLI